MIAAVTLLGAAAAASAHMGGYYNQQANDDGWFDQMYRWMDQHMGGRFGYMMGYGTGAYCPGMGPAYQENNSTEAITLEEATALLKEAVDGSFTSDVVRMGRWYAVFYEDSEGNTKQARVDIFTSQVYTDFYRYMYENTGASTGRNYRSAGRMMWG